MTRLTTNEQQQAVAAYKAEVSAKSDLERTDLAKDKSGVFTGASAINPASGERIPIWIADYVLMGYGTGAIMAVPAHDERDFEFAQKFGLAIRKWSPAERFPPGSAGASPASPATVPRGSGERSRRGAGNSGRGARAPRKGKERAAFTGDGVAINSPLIDGLATPGGESPHHRLAGGTRARAGGR